MCDTKIKKREWLCPAKTVAERSRAFRQRLKLKREIEKCFQIAPEKFVAKQKVKTTAERQQEYRQRQKSKCEQDRCTLKVSGIYLKPEIKTAEGRQRDYQQRQKLKRELKKLYEGGSTLKNRSEQETKSTKERNQEDMQAQKLIYDVEKYCDRGSMSGEDSELGNQEYAQQQTKESNVDKCCVGELTRKEHMAKGITTAVETHPDYPQPKLKQGLEKCMKRTSICGNVRTYNSSAEYFFYSMIEQ